MTATPDCATRCLPRAVGLVLGLTGCWPQGSYVLGDWPWGFRDIIQGLLMGQA